MVPCYCGLTPAMADKFSEATKAHANLILKHEIIEAEGERLAPVAISNIPAEVHEHELHIVDGPSVARQDTRKRHVTRKLTAFKASRLSIDDFHLNAVIGRGAFGKVMLATDKLTKKIYAIKTIKKANIKMIDVMRCTILMLV